MTARTIGFVVHPGEGPMVRAGVARATELGFHTWIAESEPEPLLAAHAAETALLVTVGGDGTFLYGARLAGPRGIRLLGVHRGRLGFLTDVRVDDLPSAIEAFIEGRYRVERRTMLAVVSSGHDRGASPVLDAIALNEVAVKAQGVNVVRIAVEADGEMLGEFDCDGVVVATATGSTAYALSAGGPPIDPRVRALVVVPLAAHAVMTRGVVIPEALTVVIRPVRGMVCAAADRREVALPAGACLEVRAGPELEVVRFSGAPTFLGRLREKLHFGLPLKGPDRAAAERRRAEGTAGAPPVPDPPGAEGDAGHTVEG